MTTEFLLTAVVFCLLATPTVLPAQNRPHTNEFDTVQNVASIEYGQVDVQALARQVEKNTADIAELKKKVDRLPVSAKAPPVSGPVYPPTTTATLENPVATYQVFSEPVVSYPVFSEPVWSQPVYSAPVATTPARNVWTRNVTRERNGLFGRCRIVNGRRICN